MERKKQDCVINIDNGTEGQNIDCIGDVELGLKESNQNLRGINISVNEDNKKLISEPIKPSNDKLEEEPSNNETRKVYSFQFILLLLSFIKSSINKTKLFWIVAIYTLIGANLFMWLEIPSDLEIREEARDYHLVRGFFN
ncbi:unnamed protein product [Meloidogyne enterolobii]|uniref:Uncharacterized protein n=1 Tax=Meloidogyne enterolobii TaxID=390850 RepID=A0ACB1B074_MELEN